MESEYKKIKKQLGKTDADIATMFGYSSVHSFRNATRRNQIVKGIIELSKLFELREDKEG